MSSLINKAKEAVENVLDKNKSSSQHQGDNTTSSSHGHTQGSDQYGTTHGGDGGISGTDRLPGQHTGHSTGYDNVQSGNTGPHSSNVLNKADPRVDSDRDHRSDPTSRVGGVGNTQTHGDSYGHTGGLGTTGTTHGHTGTSGITGVHGSAPIHDATTVSTGHHGHGSHTGHSGGLAAATSTGTSGIGGGNTYDDPRSTNQGPHSSGLLNKLDPRTDSDRDHRDDPSSRVGGYGGQGDNYGHTTGSHTTGTHGGLPTGTHGGLTSGTHNTGTHGGYDTGSTGTHRGYESGTTGGGLTGGHTGSQTGYAGDNTSRGYGDRDLPGSGDAPSTAGPHSSDRMNKLDPRVDSDLDGSKTYGGNQTHR